MNRAVTAVLAGALLAAMVAVSGAQESQLGPGPGMGPGGHMAGHGDMGGPGMHGGMTRGMRHLEHMMVHNPKAAARVMRFRADMLKAMSEVLARHAAELEQVQ